jgi:small subunit ribosomal protein S13
MPEQEQVKYLVRVLNTDLDGTKPIVHALTRIKGIGPMFANLVCQIAGVEHTRKAGTLIPAEVVKIEEIIQNPQKFHAPEWILNRRKDPDSGEDKHLISSSLDFAKDNDIKMMKKMKSYKGIRHMFGLPVRGQRTKSKHRRNKRKGKAALGVKRRADAKAGRS